MVELTGTEWTGAKQSREEIARRRTREKDTISAIQMSSGYDTKRSYPIYTFAVGNTTMKNETEAYGGSKTRAAAPPAER
jgi:hypothetical protein